MDVLTPEQRSRCMAAVAGCDTKPEMRLRKALHALGFRYRLHDKSLPGRPDLVFPVKRTAIFVHGCFWHRHSCKAGRSTPTTRSAFWRNKFALNVERDRRNRLVIEKMRWKVIEVWECQLATSTIDNSLLKIVRVLKSRRAKVQEHLGSN
jgi:DNA mismatch endonuclease, patch repair protein